MQQMLTVRDVATRYHVHQNTVRLWLRNGVLASHRPGKRHLIRATDVEAFILTKPGYQPRRKAPPD